MHPDREPLETLDRIRRTIGEYNFAGQYQQSPAPLGGGLVKAEWFKRYGEKDRPERFDRIVQSWDTANKATELSDFSVCTTWGVKGKDLFLIGLFRRRLEYPALKRAVREQQSLFNANVVLIEDKASGTQLIQELIAEGCYAVTRYEPTTEKTMRMNAQTAMIENGFVRIPETAPWLAEYLHEMTVFPNGKHDDRSIQPRSSWNGSKSRSRVRASTSTSASARKNSRSGANRNPSRPYGPAAAWSGKPSRRKRAELRRPLRSPYPSQAALRQGATTELAVAGEPRVRIHLPPPRESVSPVASVARGARGPASPGVWAWTRPENGTCWPRAGSPWLLFSDRH